MADYCKDAEVQSLLTPQTKEEFDGLEALILDGLHVDPGVIAIVEGKRILGDGHNREAICIKHGIAFPTRTKKFKSREDFIQWVIDNQLGRRNLTEERKAYYRGKEYLNSKSAHGDTERTKSPSGHFDHLEKTGEKVAEKHGVSEKTIRRDAAFAEAVDELKPVEKEAVLAGVSGETKSAIADGAKPKICPACARKIRLNQAHTVPKNCPDCAELRDPEPEESDEIVDDDDAAVPAKLREVFAAVALFRSASAMLAKAAVALKKVEDSRAYALTDHQAAGNKGDRRVYSTVCRTAQYKMDELRPAKVCCAEKKCKCGGKGFLTAQEAKQ